MTATDFNKLVVLHSKFLQPYAITLTRDHEQAKDLYQETVLRALLNRERFQFGTNLKGWLCTIMRNIFINNYRRSRKFPHISPASTDACMCAAEKVAQNDGWEHVRMSEIGRAIEQLPETLRVCFELHYTGYKYQEIADLLAEPLGTIKSRIHFARKTLMKQIER